jgi:uncharacterized protein (DUF1800 family)
MSKDRLPSAQIWGVLVLVCGLLSFATYAPPGNAAAVNRKDLDRSLASSPLTEEEKILHVLSRLSFGARPGDVEKVKAMGIAAYMARQLSPESIDDSALKERLRPLETIGKSSRELARLFPRPSRKARADRRAPPATRGSDNEDQKSQTDPAMREAMAGMRKVAVELSQAKILRAAYSERQLQEVMTDFWFNHFNVFIGKGADRVLTGEYERDVVRPNALGKFHDLLVATAKSPAMLFYLDNWMSADPNASERFTGLRSRMRSAVQGQNPDVNLRRPRGLNENYARELLELHTLGVEGGYTQKDVQEVARCFTGWTIRNPRQGGGFHFGPLRHDNGEKRVLGKTIPAGGGIRDGEIVLEMLSKHPSTARFISTKLCRRFVSDDPPEALVKRCASTFLKSGGDIRQVLAAIFTSPEFYSREAYRAKVKKPLELVASALRATGAEMSVPPPRILFALRSMGEMPYGCQPPTGYPDTADAWINSGALLERLNFATALAGGKIPGVRIERPDLFNAAGAGLAARLCRAILHEVPNEEFVRAIEKRVKTVEAPRLNPREEVGLIAGLILGSPEFQRR